MTGKTFCLFLAGIWSALLILAVVGASESVQAQEPSPDSSRGVSPSVVNARMSSSYQSQVASGEGELIELEEVQIHGEMQEPNVAITVARAKPQFREVALERTVSEGLNDLDLSGLKEGTPPPEKIRDWKELVKRPRR